MLTPHFLFLSRLKQEGDMDDVSAFIATRDIKKGEELFISYIEEDDEYEEREAHLRDYMFTCNCAKCVEERKTATNSSSGTDDDGATKPKHKSGGKKAKIVQDEDEGYEDDDEDFAGENEDGGEEGEDGEWAEDEEHDAEEEVKVPAKKK